MLLLLVVVGVDLSKSVFEHSRITGRARLTRSQFERWFTDRDVGTLVMEACGSAHHWGRWLAAMGARGPAAAGALRGRLCDAQQDQRRRRRCAATGAARRGHCARMGEVGRATGAAGPASIAQRLDGHAHRALQHTARLLPRVRHHASWRWPTISQGSRLGIEQIGRVLADPASGVASLLRPTTQLADRGEPAAGGAHRSAREATRAAGTPIARLHSYVLARAFAAHVKGSLTSPHCS